MELTFQHTVIPSCFLLHAKLQAVFRRFFAAICLDAFNSRIILTDIGQYDYTPKSVNMSIEEEKKMITYDNLWKTMKEKGISQYSLIKEYHISPGQITRLKRNESVSTHTIEMFCRILKCRVEDVMQFTEEE